MYLPLVECDPGKVLRPDGLLNALAESEGLDFIRPVVPSVAVYECVQCGTREYSLNGSTSVFDNCTACWDNASGNSVRSTCGKYI